MSIFGDYKDLDTALIKHMCFNSMRYLYQVNKYYYKLLRPRINKMVDLSKDFPVRKIDSFIGWLLQAIGLCPIYAPDDIYSNIKQYFEDNNCFNQKASSACHLFDEFGYVCYAGVLVNQICDYEVNMITKYCRQNISMIFCAFYNYYPEVRKQRPDFAVKCKYLANKICNMLGLNFDPYLMFDIDDKEQEEFDIYWNGMCKKKLIY